MMNFNRFLCGDVAKVCDIYSYYDLYSYYKGISAETVEDNKQQKIINNWIERINEEKRHNPNMDISEFINREFGEERGKVLFQVYSDYSKIMKDGGTDIIIRAKRYSIENFEYRKDEYLNRIDELEQVLNSKQEQINKIFGDKEDPRNAFNKISSYGKILDREKFNELIKLKRKCDALIKQFYYFESISFHNEIELRNETFNDHIIKQISNLSKQLIDKERTFIAALLITKPENKKFFENYNKYTLEIKKYIGNKINEIKERLISENFRKKYDELVKVECKETEEEISRFIPIKPNVFIKFLPILNRYGIYFDSYNIRQDCCLEFDLEYDINMNVTFLKMFLDIYHVASGGEFGLVTKRYKCDNIERHKILHCFFEGNRSINEIVKSSEEIQNIIRILNSSDFYESRYLIEKLRDKSKEEYRTAVLPVEKTITRTSYYQNFENYTTKNCHKPNKIFEMGIFRKNGNIICFEDFNDDKGNRLFRIVNIDKFIPRRPMEEECKIKLEDKAFLIEKVENSSRTDQDKLILIDKINSNKLDEADKLFLEDEIRSDIIKRTNETINKIGRLLLYPYDHHYQSYKCCYQIPERMDRTINRITENKINLYAINKINESNLDEFAKMIHLDPANLDLTTKLTLIEIISSAKFDEKFKNEYDSLTDIESCQDYIIDVIKSNILEDKEMWNKYFTSVLNPKDQRHKSIFDFKELFGDTSKEQLKCEVRESAIPRILDQIEQDEEREKAVLEAVMAHYTVRETMEDVHIYGNKTYPYYCSDGVKIKILPYQSETGILRGLIGAAEEINRRFQLGLKMVE